MNKKLLLTLLFFVVSIWSINGVVARSTKPKKDEVVPDDDGDLDPQTTDKNNATDTGNQDEESPEANTVEDDKPDKEKEEQDRIDKKLQDEDKKYQERQKKRQRDEDKQEKKRQDRDKKIQDRLDKKLRDEAKKNQDMQDKRTEDEDKREKERQDKDKKEQDSIDKKLHDELMANDIIQDNSQKEDDQYQISHVGLQDLLDLEHRIGEKAGTIIMDHESSPHACDNVCADGTIPDSSCKCATHDPVYSDPLYSNSYPENPVPTNEFDYNQVFGDHDHVSGFPELDAPEVFGNQGSEVHGVLDPHVEASGSVTSYQDTKPVGSVYSDTSYIDPANVGTEFKDTGFVDHPEYSEKYTSYVDQPADVKLDSANQYPEIHETSHHHHHHHNPRNTLYWT